MKFMDVPVDRLTACTLTGRDMLAHIVEECRRIGLREIARRTKVTPSTMVNRLREPQFMRLSEFFEIVQAIGAAPQLVIVPTPPPDLANRRQRARYQRRSPVERGELPTPEAPRSPGGGEVAPGSGLIFSAASCGCFFLFVAAVAAEREEVVGNMIEALESRQLLSVPNIAGNWVGKVAQKIDDGAEQQAAIAVTFVQSGNHVACVESDGLDSTHAYCRGTIDSKGRMKLNWSARRNMSPILARGVAWLARGRLNSLLDFFTSSGSHVVIGFKVHRR